MTVTRKVPVVGASGEPSTIGLSLIPLNGKKPSEDFWFQWCRKSVSSVIRILAMAAMLVFIVVPPTMLLPLILMIRTTFETLRNAMA